MRPRRGVPWFVPPLVLAAAIALVALAGEDRRSAAAERADGSPPARLTMTGRTTQGEPITAVLRGERLVAFDTRLRLQCGGGHVGSAPRRLHWSANLPSRGSDGVPTFDHGVTAWQTTWRPALGPRGTVISRRAIAPRDGNAATSTITAEVGGHTLTGTLLTSIAVKTVGGSYATCTAGGVRFRLEP